MEKVAESLSEEIYRERNADEKIVCIHPDLKGTSVVSRRFARGNIFSIKCEICAFCGFTCHDSQKTVPTKKTDAHFVSSSFIYCPVKNKIIQIAVLSAREICPLEIGGCGHII